MLEATLFLALSLGLLLPLWQRREDPTFGPLLQWVYRAETRLLLGQNIFRSDAAVPNSDRDLIQAHYKQLYFQGLSLETPLRALYELLLQSQVWSKLEARWQALVATRLLCLLGLIFVGRLLLALLVQAGLLPAWSRPLDLSLAVLGLGLVAAAVWGCKTLLPKDWFWQRGFTTKAKLWLDVRCLGKWDSPGEWQDLWLELNQQERLNGLSLAKEKEKILELWVKEQALEQQERVSRFEDLLPLWELFGGCLLGFCLLFAPLYACLQHYQRIV